MKTAFIGHRRIYAKDIDKRLKIAIENEIKKGCKSFIMGTHGEFDRFALSVCKRLQKNCKELEIVVAITSLTYLQNNRDDIYNNVDTIMYDIEEAHFKRRIILSNRRMIDECDTLICYVNTSNYRSGAKRALRHAERQGLKIINLYREEDEPFYGMTKEQISEYWQSYSEKLQ